LVDTDGAITGETSECGTLPSQVAQAFPALIEGSRSGHSVWFRKFYDDLRLAADVVEYDGHIAFDGNEISGEWHIPGECGGTFIMIRAGAAAIEAERSDTVPVR
jgi:hypothetical protein